MKYMLDTNICIYIIKQKPVHVLRKFKEHQLSDIVISSITFAELEYGVQKSVNVQKNSEALSLFVAPLDIVPYDDIAAVEYGAIRSALERSGRVIGAMNMLIAAHAKSLNLPIVTNNTKEFDRVSGLTVMNWVVE